MNVLFLAKEPSFYLEYASRLETNDIPFWTAHSSNDFHAMFDRMIIDVVFADYNFMDFSKFDVYKHIKSKGGKFVFLFLNETNQTNNLFIQWEDKITEYFPDFWTNDLEALLRLVANQPFVGEYILESEKIENLLVKRDVEDKIPFQVQNLSIPNEVTDEEKNQKELLTTEKDIVTKTVWSYKEQKNEEKKLVESFFKIKKNYNLSFSEFLLLDLFRRKKNELVSLCDMIKLLDMPLDEKNIKKIYRYIHCIRAYLEKCEGGLESISRVKKGFYCLVSMTEEVEIK